MTLYYNSITNGRDPIFVYYVQNELIVPIHSSVWIYSLYILSIDSLCSYGGNMWVFKINFIWYMYTHTYTYIELHLIAEVVLQTAQLYWHLPTSTYFTQFFSVTHVWFAWLSVDMGRACMGSAPDHRFGSDFFISLFSEQWAAWYVPFSEQGLATLHKTGRNVLLNASALNS